MTVCHASGARGVAALVAALALACDAGQHPRPAAREPLARNVLVVTVDTLRADAVGALGGPADATPAIDALAARSLVFERAYSPATITHPALSSMLTGLFPLRHGVNGQAGQLHEGVVALPEILGAHGIETASFVANLCKLQDEPRTVFAAGWDTAACGMDLDIEQHRWDESVVDQALAWLAARPPSAERRWLAWVHLMDPHAEHRPPASQWDYQARPVLPKLEQYQEFGAYEEQRVMPPEQRLRDLLDLYAAEVRGSDAQLARLFAAVDARADRADTAVIFSADHGEELFETWSRYDHGLSLTEGVLWVPLLVQAPGLAPGRERAPVELLQVTPTVLELFGLEPPYALDGASLLAPEPSRGFAVSGFGNIALTARDAEHRVWWRRGDEAYHRPEGVAPWRADAPWFLEKRCLARYPGPRPTAVEWLDLEPGKGPGGRLEARLQEFLHGLGELRRSTRIEDPALAAQLRELGYLGGE